MATINRSRTIRPSTRLEKSKSYKVDTKNIGTGDMLAVTIHHESDSFSKTYLFEGTDLSDRNSISFRVNDYETHIDVRWSGVTPQKTISPAKPVIPYKNGFPEPLNPITVDRMKKNFIEELAPIEDEKSQILILGTMPGVESLKQQAYYGHPRNLFWKLIAGVTGETAPESYDDKKKYLLKHKIALWDMCQACIRSGSLDSNISDEVPNDITSFIAGHHHLKAIGCNGRESARMFRKYRVGIENVTFIPLPSSSPANAGVSWEKKADEWSRLKEFI